MNHGLQTCLFLTLLSTAPALEASRLEALDKQFVPLPQTSMGAPTLLDFPFALRASQYPTLHLPQAPVFHPLDPRQGLGSPGPALCVTFNVKLPGAFFEALPAGILRKLEERGVPQGNVDIFWVVQNQPWNDAPILFRPHYWADPEAPAVGPYNRTCAIEVGIFEAQGEIRFAGHGSQAFFGADIQIQGPDQGAVLSAPGNLGVEVPAPNRTRSFWTLTICQGRAAATLHVLLNQADQAAMLDLSARVRKLRDLTAALDQENSPFRGSSLTRKFKQLTRPILGGERPDGGDHRLVTGSGFTAATTVELGNQALAYEVLDDATLRVACKAPLGNLLRIITPMGESLAPAQAASASAPPLPEAAPGKDPNLWTRGLDKPMVVLDEKNNPGVYQEMACFPGETFEGSCVLAVENLTKGIAQINLFFTRPGGGPTYGVAMGHGMPQKLGVNGKGALAVRGTAPAGATKVTFYIQIHGGNLGAKATFQKIGFIRQYLPLGGRAAQALPLQAQDFPATPNLWKGPEESLLTAAGNGTHGQYLDVPCAPGDQFTGTCFVRTERVDSPGLAQINLAFKNAAGAITGYGAALDAWTPHRSESEARRFLGIQGQAPAGTTQVMFFVKVERCQAGARAVFDHVAFRKLPAPTVAASVPQPATPGVAPLKIVHFQPGASLVARGGPAELHWKVEGGPTSLTLKDANGSTLELPLGSQRFHTQPIRRRQAFKLIAVRDQPPAEVTSEVSVAVQGVDRLAGDTLHGNQAYLNGPMDGQAAWRHLTGLLWHDGELFFAEGEDHTIRKLGRDGSVAAAAGMRGSPAHWGAHDSPERLHNPGGMAFMDGFIYVADTGSHTIKRFLANGAGQIQIVAGGSLVPGLANGGGRNARFNQPVAVLAVPLKKMLYVADAGNNCIRKIHLEAGGQFKVETLSVQIPDPRGLAVVPGGGRHPEQLFVSSGEGAFLTKLEIVPRNGLPPQITSTVLAGAQGDPGFLDAVGASARFRGPKGLALVDGDSALLVADSGNRIIRRLNLASGMVDTWAGEPCVAGDGDGHRTEVRFQEPSHLVLGDHGDVFVGDLAGRALRRIAADGQVTALGGNRSGSAAGRQDGPSGSARFDHPLGVVVGKDGTAYVADQHNHAVRRIRPDGEVDTYAGQLGMPGSAGGMRLEARFTGPEELALDAKGRLYVLEPASGSLWMIDQDHVSRLGDSPTRVAASPTWGDGKILMAFGGEAGRGHVTMVGKGFRETVAKDLDAVALAVGPQGQVFVLTRNPEEQNVVLHKYTQTGASWQESDRPLAFGPDGEVGRTAGIPRVHGMAVDASGHALLADSANGVVWKANFATRSIKPLVGAYPFLAVTPPEGSPLRAPLDEPHRIAVTPQNDLVVTAGHAVLKITAPEERNQGGSSSASSSATSSASSPSIVASLLQGVHLKKRTSVESANAAKEADPIPAAGFADLALRAMGDGMKRYSHQVDNLMEKHRKAQEEDDEWDDTPAPAAALALPIGNQPAQPGRLGSSPQKAPVAMAPTSASSSSSSSSAAPTPKAPHHPEGLTGVKLRMAQIESERVAKVKALEEAKAAKQREQASFIKAVREPKKEQ
jgi:DNA-binding beta-propeller fold protein YncE